MRAFTQSLWVLCALGLAQCRKQPEPEGGALSTPSSAAAQLSTTSTVSPAPVASVEPAASIEPVAAAPKPQAGLGKWLEASLYDFKAVAIHHCPAATLVPESQHVQAAPSATSRIGVTVQIRAKVDSLLASPRDVTLEHSGVILQAELSPSPGCGTSLPTKQLRKGETALGEVVFTLPDTEFARALTLHFKPTRWGGAPDVTLEMPECLADCAAGKPAQTRIRSADSAPSAKTR